MDGTIVAAILTAIAGAIGWQMNERRKTKSLHRMLYAEMCSFISVISNIELAEKFDAVMRHPTTQAVGWMGGGISKENYFTVFEANATSLGSLHPSVVRHIAGCYCLMKGSRDAARHLGNWNEYSPEQRISGVCDVARLVAHSIDEAMLATRELEKIDSSLVWKQEWEADSRRWHALADQGRSTLSRRDSRSPDQPEVRYVWGELVSRG